MTCHRLFFWTLLALVPTQLGYHLWPDWAMVLGRRVDYLSPTLFLTDILIFGVLFFWLIHAFPRIHYSKFFILFLLFVGLNIFFAADKPVAIYKWIKVVELVLLGWYIVKTKPSLSFIIFPLSLGVLYSSVLALAQFVLQHSIGGPLWWLGERTFTIDTSGIARFNFCQPLTVNCQLLLRPYATFPHPNVLGGFLAATLPLLISNFQYPISNQTKKFSMFKITTIVLGAIALFLTFSRSAIVVGVVASALVLWQKVKYKTLTTILIVIVTGIALSFIISSEESVVIRQQLNEAAIKLWQQSPLVGVGLGNFLVKLPEALPSRAVYFLQPVHNIYLLMLAEAGIVGLVIFFWVVLKSVQCIVYSVKKKYKNAFSLYTLHFTLFTFLLLGLIDHYPLTLQQGQLLFILFLSLNLIRSQRTIS